MRNSYYDIKPVCVAKGFGMAPKNADGDALFCRDWRAAYGITEEVITGGWKLITSRSHLIYRKGVENVAAWFRREMQFDFLQYHPDERDRDNDRVYAYIERGLILGAAVFRLREDKGERPILSLAWVNMHPYTRRRGVLSQVWPMFRAMYGDFPIEGPLSPAMQQFILKHEGHQ